MPTRSNEPDPPASRKVIETTAREVVAPVLPDEPAAPSPALPEPVAQHPALRVEPDGAIRQVDEAAQAEPLAEVTPEVFAADIEAIGKAMEQGQRTGAFNKDNQVRVGPRGEIVVGGEDRAPEPLSEVTPEVFASLRLARQ